MPWNWRNIRRAIGEHCVPQNRRQSQQLSANSRSSISPSSTVVQSLSSGRRISADSATRTSKASAAADDGYQSTDTRVCRSTPVLFCTSRGLHLRVTRPLPNTSVGTATSVSMRRSSSCRHIPTATAYDIRFCDLERWSTNRANTVSLEDTFTMSPRNASVSHMETIESSGHSGVSQQSDNSCFLAIGRNSMSLARCSNNHNNKASCSIQNTFSRFGLE